MMHTPQALMSLLLLAACSGAADTATPVEEVDLYTEVTSIGAWSVGWRTDTVSYTDPTGAARELKLSVWYPSADIDGPAAEYRGAIEDPDAFADAVPANEDFPVIVFSHGHQGYAENSSFLMTFLASHGFVVAAPDHTNNTLFDGSGRDTEIYAQRPADISAVLDHLGASAAIGLGHSFGGYTLHALAGATYDVDTVAACAPKATEDGFCSTMTRELEALFLAGFTDARFLTHISMAPGDFRLFGAAGLAAVQVPVLHMTGSMDPQTGGDSEDIWAAFQASGTGSQRVELVGGGHQTFTDFSGQLEEADMAPEEGWTIVQAYALGWAKATVGDPERYAPLFSGELSISDSAWLE